MKTLEQLTLSEARNSARKVFVKWTDVCAGNRRTLTEETTTVGHLLDLIEAASNDPTREAVERLREARTGIPWNENWTSAPSEAEETLGDNIKALNGGDDDIRVFDIPEFADLLEQFQDEKFNANTFPTADQVSEILFDTWIENDGTTLECDTITGRLHQWEISDEIPSLREWNEKLLAQLGFDQFREPANVCRGGNGDVIWFLDKTDKEVSEILDAIREEALIAESRTEGRFAITDSEGNPMGYGSSEEQAIQDAAEALDITTEKVEELLALREGPEAFCWADKDWFMRWAIDPNETFKARTE